MIDERELRRALDLKAKAYGLVRWLAGELDRGRITLTAARDALSMIREVRGWIERSYDILPPEHRPEAGELKDFGHMIASFLPNSFDLKPQPGTRDVRRMAWYGLEVDGEERLSHLQAKKPARQQKRRAWDLQLAALMRHAAEAGRKLSREDAIFLMGTENLRESTAVVAYARDLLERMKGKFEGPAVLALWRQFAWTESAPKRGYRLTVEAVKAAETRIDQALRTIPAG